MRFDRTRRRWRYALEGLALVVSAGVLLYGVCSYHLTVDWTRNERHSLHNASKLALSAVTLPLTATVYLPDRHPNRELAKNLVLRYQRANAALSLHFVDPAAVPELMRNEEIREGEMMLSAGDRRERVRQYTEAAFTNALMRLARKDTQWLAFVTGHGERSPSRGANFDLSDFAAALAQRGVKAREVNLADTPTIPDNAAALVIASPQVDFLPGEITVIQGYLARGGALLWLLEPEVPGSLQTLAASLGITLNGDTVIDPGAQAMGIDDPAMALVSHYETHPALGRFNATALLPHATPLVVKALPGWQLAPLFVSNPGAWGERSSLKAAVSFDPAEDLRGPLTLGLALRHQAQRIVLVGDGDFLSNSYLGNGGNRELGTRLVEWLAANETLVEIDAVSAPDSRLDLSPWQIGVMGGAFLIALPGACLLNGLWLWWRRRA